MNWILWLFYGMNCLYLWVHPSIIIDSRPISFHFTFLLHAYKLLELVSLSTKLGKRLRLKLFKLHPADGWCTNRDEPMTGSWFVHGHATNLYRHNCQFLHYLIRTRKLLSSTVWLTWYTACKLILWVATWGKIKNFQNCADWCQEGHRTIKTSNKHE